MTFMMDKKSLQFQKGSILPLTLIILAILTSLAVSVSQQARETLENMNQIQHEWSNELEYRSVLQEVIQSLLLGEVNYNEISFNGKNIPIDGRVIQVKGVDVQVQDMAGVLNLGKYLYRDKTATWLFNLLRQATDKQTASHIRGEYIDWTDMDDIKSRYGMEAKDYYQLPGKKNQPRNAPLRHLDELLELPSMTAKLYNSKVGKYRLREHLTVGTCPFINIATASGVVLKAVFSLSDKQTMSIIKARQRRQWKKVERLLPKEHTAYNKLGLFIRNSIYRITIRKKNAASLTTTIMLNRYGSAPYKIQLWHYPDNERGWTL